jgi:hypothetical protein
MGLEIIPASDELLEFRIHYRGSRTKKVGGPHDVLDVFIRIHRQSGTKERLPERSKDRGTGGMESSICDSERCPRNPPYPDPDLNLDLGGR